MKFYSGCAFSENFEIFAQLKWITSSTSKIYLKNSTENAGQSWETYFSLVFLTVPCPKCYKIHSYYAQNRFNCAIYKKKMARARCSWKDARNSGFISSIEAYFVSLCYIKSKLMWSIWPYLASLYLSLQHRIYRLINTVRTLVCIFNNKNVHRVTKNPRRVATIQPIGRGSSITVDQDKVRVKGTVSSKW